MSKKSSRVPPDAQTTDRDWKIVEGASIAGVVIKEILPVVTSTGTVTEVFRSDWLLDEAPVGQVFQRSLHPGVVTGWHAHAHTIDRLFCATGTIRVSLYDGRTRSETFGSVWHRLVGAARPAIVVIPPGVWHGVVTVGPDTAMLLNVVDRAYDYESPDHWRLPPDSELIPYKLG
jgi:dTDP-4-dehydrorhamnose 3,5-epimerase